MSKATAEITRNVKVDPARVFVDEKIRTRHAAPNAKKVESLAESIKAHGQQNSILVRPYAGPDTKDYDYTLIAGENRVEACKLLGENVRADVYPIDDEEEAIVAGFVENHDRNELTPLDEYHTVKLLSERGMKGKDIAERLGVQQAHVSRLKKLDNLSPSILNKLGKGDLTMHQCLALLEIGDEAKREKYAADGLTADQITELARRQEASGSGRGGKGGANGTPSGGRGSGELQRNIGQVKEALEAALNAPGATPETPVPLGAVAQVLLQFIAGDKDLGVPDWFNGIVEGKMPKKRRKKATA